VRLLVVATKAPWPPVDGGRLLLLRTLEGFAAQGVRATLVAPLDVRRHAPEAVAAALGAWCEAQLVPARPAGAASTLLRSAGHRVPLTIARHTLPAVRRRVEGLLAARRFDLVHAEQLQALPQAMAPARARHRPLVLRAQNVESALWAAVGQGRPLSLEARRLAAWEGRAVAGVDATAALTAIDAAALRRLAAAAGSPRARVVEVPAPFAADLPPGAACLAGEPPVVLLGSGGWRPNEDAIAWFTGEIWPEVSRALPAAQLHVFGAASEPPGSRDAPPRTTRHGAPADSAAAFASGSIHVVPLRFGSGVRMKVLESWARGVPVVATPEGAAGLEATDGVELLVAKDAAGFIAAFRRLATEPHLSEALVRAGRAALRRRHDPAAVARRLLDLYADLMSNT
jgi:polysaccharide biosynthesis protein PslH